MPPGGCPDALRKGVYPLRGHARVAVECGCGRTAALVAPGMMGVRRRAALAMAGGALSVCVGEVPQFGGFLPFFMFANCVDKCENQTVLVTEVKGFC